MVIDFLTITLKVVWSVVGIIAGIAIIVGFLSYYTDRNRDKRNE